jgi:polyhydroxyalkanoate synthase subunit PhaC
MSPQSTQPQPDPNPPPLLRQGPRPLLLHLMTASAVWGSSRLALPFLKSGLLPWNPALNDQVQNLLHALDGIEPAELDAAVDVELRRRSDRFLAGVECYRRHPYCRSLTEPPTVWQEGSTRILDYGPADGVPVLVIPSLVNRAYILDIDEERSFLRYLSGRGLRCLLIDWGIPGEVERGFDLTDYIAGRLDQAFEAATALVGERRVGVIGYCMGGLFALALASRHQRDIAGVVLIATPWDFHAGATVPPAAVAALSGLIETSYAPLGEVPTDALQALFVMNDPQLAIRKFTRFGELDPQSAEARQFVATEDWANDGMPLALPVARDCLTRWFGRNEPATGHWRVAGRAVDPARITRPVLMIIPSFDKVVPAASSRPLAAQLPHVRVIEQATGHIGLVVAPASRQPVWTPVAGQLLDWGSVQAR